MIAIVFMINNGFILFSLDFWSYSTGLFGSSIEIFVQKLRRAVLLR